MRVSSNEYKLLTEREVHYQQLLKRNIFKEIDNKKYLPEALDLTFYFEDIDKYMTEEKNEDYSP